MGVIYACALIVSGVVPGGAIPDFTGLADRLRATGCTVRIEGTCASACTVLLDVPGACIAPGAELMFHGPSWGGKPMAKEDFDKWSAELARHYPRLIARWYLQEGRMAQHWMRGREAVRLGARACSAQDN